MAASLSGEKNRSTRREPQKMGT